MMKLKNPTDNIVYAIIAGFYVNLKFLANSNIRQILDNSALKSRNCAYPQPLCTTLKDKDY
jgi:hypothetical protein